ncbi:MULTISPECIES: alpha/beta hydrolase [Streptomyces]|uniref:alpha/beta fold hydrolase n=1 Tax=Streptomyces TaxID=1883 RepID=UPI001E5EB9B7|nr:MULTISPECIES: alpha/beta hydrolase [Streptomyces]
MATYVLIPGAGTDSWYWHRVAPLLRARGHDVVTPDLPCADETAGLAEYTEVVLEAIGDRKDLVLVAQSMGGFTAPLVCARVPVELMVLVAAMVPAPGESPGDWWANTGQPGARRELDVREGRDPDAEFDPRITFLHDVPEDVAAALMVRPAPRRPGTAGLHPGRDGRRPPPGAGPPAGTGRTSGGLPDLQPRRVQPVTPVRNGRIAASREAAILPGPDAARSPQEFHRFRSAS